MVETRFRLVGLIEWVIAAGCVLATIVGAAFVAADFRTVRPVVHVIASAAEAQIAPANLRPGSISMPELVLPDGKQLKVGASASLLDVLGPRAQYGATAYEHTDHGQRESRTYRYAGMEFVIVVADGRIAAIFR